MRVAHGAQVAVVDCAGARRLPFGILHRKGPGRADLGRGVPALPLPLLSPPCPPYIPGPSRSSFPCPSSRPPGRPGSSQRMLGAPLLPLPPSAGVRATGASGPSPRCCRCPAFCRRKEARTRVWLRSRRLGEAERGAFVVAVALGSPGPPATRPEAGPAQPLWSGSFSAVHSPVLSADLLSHTYEEGAVCDFQLVFLAWHCGI